MKARSYSRQGSSHLGERGRRTRSRKPITGAALEELRQKNIEANKAEEEAKRSDKMYRFQITVPDVYDYLFDKFVTHLASYKNQISGWIKESRIPELQHHFIGKEIRLIENTEYWMNYELYQ